MTTHYSPLGPSHGTNDIPLSRISSSSDVHKLPQWQDTFASQDSVTRPKKRGILGAVSGWWLEIGSVALAFAVMLVTVVLLAHYNGKQLSETPRRPNLNTLVNIFSTIEASLLVFVAAEILSQAKWLRMQARSTLNDFNVVDNASRGLRGAVQVIVKPHLGPMATIGALVTILAIAIGPMLQETVVLRSAWLPDSDRNASAPISKFFAPNTNPQLPKLDIGLKGTILNGLSAANTSARDPIYGCPSGNCTFSRPYTSLGVCHACQRLEVTRQCNAQNNCNYTLANGHILTNNPTPSGFEGDFNFINVSTAFDTTALMTGIINNNLVEHFDVTRASIISLTNGPLCKTNGSNPDCVLDTRDNATQTQLFDGGVIGAYCDLALCSKTYRADITDARLTEHIIDTKDYRDTSAVHYAVEATDALGMYQADPAVLPGECYLDGKAYSKDEYMASNNESWSYIELLQTMGGGNQNFSDTRARAPIHCVFAMRRVTYASLIQFMTRNPVFLDGSGTSDSNTGVAGGVFSFLPNGGDSPFLFANQAAFGVEPIFNNGNASFESIDASFGRLANAITKYMRDNSGHDTVADYTGVEGRLASVPAQAKGVLYVGRTVVFVQWYWIILPLVVLFSVMVYLIVAIVQGGVKDLNGNTQAHLWKSSAIVPLVIGHRSQLPHSFAALDDPKEMYDLKKRRMQLVGSKGGWMFVETETSDVR